MTGAQTLRIRFEGRRAVGVDVRRGEAAQSLDARREGIVAAGALQSPQLLMLSGIGPGAHLREHGIAVRHDLSGVGLCTPDEALPDLQLHFVIGKLVEHGRKTAFSHGYSCHVCLLRPRSRGSLRLASADPTAAPAIDPNFLGERDDVDRLVRGFKLMRHVLRQPAIAGHGGRELDDSATARADPQIEQFVRNRADTVYHPVGECADDHDRREGGRHDSRRLVEKTLRSERVAIGGDTWIATPQKTKPLRALTTRRGGRLSSPFGAPEVSGPGILTRSDCAVGVT
jgi:choline dehydrogenase-like flavoprotein